MESLCLNGQEAAHEGQERDNEYERGLEAKDETRAIRAFFTQILLNGPIIGQDQTRKVLGPLLGLLRANGEMDDQGTLP